jgi:hypothetical protein
MPLLYGEGTRAFYRLQLEVLSISGDHTIFLWDLPQSDWYSTAYSYVYRKEQDMKTYGMLAQSPDWFHMHTYTETENRPCRTDMLLSTHEKTKMGLRIKLPCTHRRNEIVYAILNCCSPNNQWLAVPLENQTSGRYNRSIHQRIEKCSADEVREPRLMEFIAQAEPSIHSSKILGGPQRFMIKSVRLWDFPHELTGLDWLRSDRQGRDVLSPDRRAHQAPVVAHDLRDRCVLNEGESGALRLYIGDLTIMVAFSMHQQQPCLGLFQTRHSTHEELARLWEQYKTKFDEYNRDYLRIKVNGMTFTISAKKQLWKRMPCWLLMVEIWDTAKGGTGNEGARTRPNIHIERDLACVTAGHTGRGMKISRQGYDSQALSESPHTEVPPIHNEAQLRCVPGLGDTSSIARCQGSSGLDWPLRSSTRHPRSTRCVLRWTPKKIWT